MKARPARSTTQRSRSRGDASLYTFFIATAVVVGWFWYTATTLPPRLDGPGSLRGSLPTIDELYGPAAGRWPASSASAGGPSQLLVLSYYGSWGSAAARLLMLFGVYAGEPDELRIDADNRLRWWELQQLTKLNNLVLQQYTSKQLPAHLARGFHTSSMTSDSRDYYNSRLADISSHLGRHKPWLLQDPRLSWLAALWLERLDSPMCLLVLDMAPQRLAQHLERQQEHWAVASGAGTGERQGVVSAGAHLERWTNATLSALKACAGVPTLIIPNSVLKPPLLQPFLPVLQQHLVAAGVVGTRLPPEELLQQQYLAHLPPPGDSSSWCTQPAGSNSSSSSAGANSTSLLEQPCNWLPPKPQSGTTGVIEGGQSAAAAASTQDAALLSLPTQALLSALSDHLVATLTHPFTTPVRYSRVAGEVYSAYAATVKQLIAREGSGTRPDRHGEHYHIGALIVDALKHVDSTATVAAAHP